MSGYTRTEGRPARDSIVPRFHMEAVEDPAGTAREGRPCWRQEERVQFMAPGSTNQHVARVTDEHRQRWPEAYAAFKSGVDAPVDGIPLEQWPALNKAQVFELRALHINTVEQCAALADTAVQQIKYGMRLRELAKAYLDEAYEQAALAKALAERDVMQSEVSDLRAKVAELTRICTELHTQSMASRDRLPDTATAVPYHSDASQFRQSAFIPDEPSSSLENLPAPRRRGRPPNSERPGVQEGV